MAQSADRDAVKVSSGAETTVELVDGVRLRWATGEVSWRGLCVYAASPGNDDGFKSRFAEHVSGQMEVQLLWHPGQSTRIVLDFLATDKSHPLWATFVLVNRDLLRAGLHHPVEDLVAAVFPAIRPNGASTAVPVELCVEVVADRSWGRISVQIPTRPLSTLLVETYGRAPLPPHVPVVEVLEARRLALRRGDVDSWRDTRQMLSCVAEALSVVIGASATLVRSMPQYLANHQQAVVLASMLGEYLISAPSFPASRAGQLYPGEGPLTPADFERCWQPNGRDRNTRDHPSLDDSVADELRDCLEMLVSMIECELLRPPRHTGEGSSRQQADLRACRRGASLAKHLSTSWQKPWSG